MVEFAGYPCCHVIALYKFLHKTFPNHLINRRLVKGKHNISKVLKYYKANNTVPEKPKRGAPTKLTIGFLYKSNLVFCYCSVYSPIYKKM